MASLARIFKVLDRSMQSTSQLLKISLYNYWRVSMDVTYITGEVDCHLGEWFTSRLQIVSKGHLYVVSLPMSTADYYALVCNSSSPQSY